jgi:rfaE bifunctional protein kinase chain/domain
VKQDRIREILGNISKVSMAVYGDFCLDAYWLMDPEGSEVSVETGLKAEAVQRHVYSPGGAGNIVANLAALRPAAIRAIGVIGPDIHGRELLAQLRGLGADTASLVIQQGDFDTYTYTKRIRGEQEDPRIDFGYRNRRSADTDQRLLNEIRQALEKHDALIFNQQVSESLSREFIDGANQLFEQFNDKIVVVDSRHFNAAFRHVYRKVNEAEAAVLSGLDAGSRSPLSIQDVKRYASRIYEQSGKPVFVTCGDRGMISMDAGGINEYPGIQLLTKLDTVGAGDTAISAISLCLAAGIPVPEAAEFANLAAAVTVQKLFTTGTASGEEIMALNRDVDYNHRPDLASDLRLARYIPDSEIELCDSAPIEKARKSGHALFDHDGTVSVLRQGWEKIMEEMMTRAIMGDRYRTANTGLYQEVRKQVLSYIDMSTGIQTILQMEALVGMVRDFNLVPEGEILDQFAYKKIYNDALLKVVSGKLDKLARGQLHGDDLVVKGSVGFLQALKDKGLKLYLASGTDQEDVINEAQVLGYAGLFEGGIYGSENDIRKYSKKMIINRIIREHGLEGHELLVFGDGPVEIRECVKSGGIAVGVASDEVRRYGLNEDKRSRLIRSGARVIIPDFSQADRLMDLLIHQ